MSFSWNLDGATVSFLNYGNGQAIDLPQGKSTPGTEIHGWQYIASRNQEWRLERVESDSVWPTFIIRHPTTGLVLEVKDGSSEHKTPIVTREVAANRKNNNQLWYLVTADTKGRVYAIQNVASGNYIGLTGGDRTNGAKVQSNVGSIPQRNANQTWRILRLDNN